MSTRLAATRQARIATDNSGKTNTAALAMAGAAGIIFVYALSTLATAPLGCWSHEWMVPHDGEAYQIEARLYREPQTGTSLWLEAQLQSTTPIGNNTNTTRAWWWRHAEKLVVRDDAGRESYASPCGPIKVDYMEWYGDRFAYTFDAEPREHETPTRDGVVRYPVVPSRYLGSIERVTITAVPMDDVQNGTSRITVTVKANSGLNPEYVVQDGWTPWTPTNMPGEGSP